MSAPIELTRRTGEVFIYTGVYVWIFYRYFCTRAVVIPLRAVDLAILVELRACTLVQLSIGISTIVATTSAHPCQVGS